MTNIQTAAGSPAPAHVLEVSAMLAAAPTPPAQERKPLGPYGVQKLIIKLNSEHGENWNHGDLVRAAEIHHGIGTTNAD